MYKKHKLGQFTITDQSRQQIKMIVPSLFNDNERALVLKTILLMRDAIEEVSVEIKRNVVVINYNPEQLPRQNLLNLLEGVLKNFSQKPKIDIDKTKSNRYQFVKTAQTVVLKIEGMSCNSCALFLEMVLSRHRHVVQATVNYKLELGTVKSFLEASDIIQIIADNGYQAMVSGVSVDNVSGL